MYREDVSTLGENDVLQIVSIDLEEKAQDNQEKISALQKKISKLTKSLDDVSIIYRDRTANTIGN